MLKFNSDGKFKIMQVADIQDTQLLNKNTFEFLGAALDREKPDLVVLTGDQIKGYGLTMSLANSTKNCEKIIKTIIEPMDKRGIPFTFVFGNHDSQAFASSKEEQLEAYKSSQYCLAEAGERELAGLCNHNLEIKDEKGKKTLFNIYLIDSLGASVSGVCDAVSEGQIEWYRSTRERLKKENGSYVPSLVFQHIPVPEIWNLVKEVPKSHKPHAVGYGKYAGKYYTIDENYLIPGNCDFMFETPGAADSNNGEFDALTEKGEVLGAFFGHDHNNSFVGKYNGLAMGYCQGCGFNVYGPGMDRGVRIIEIDKNNLNTFNTYTVMYRDVLNFKDIHNKPKYLMYTYSPPSVQAAMPLIKSGVGATVGLAALSAALIIRKFKKNK